LPKASTGRSGSLLRRTPIGLPKSAGGGEQATRGTLAAYVAAPGGPLRLVAEFEDERLALG
jgi:hypothetical protein